MSFKQCSGCQSMVAESKAFCPDCDTPMDVEQKRHDTSEFELQMKTQNLTGTSQLLLLEQLNLSTFFSFPPKKNQEPEVIQPESSSIQPIAPVIQAQPVQPNQVIETPAILGLNQNKGLSGTNETVTPLNSSKPRIAGIIPN